ncbi:Ubiquitin carboxyl-terminal hydrolase 36, partial [Gryllus bimaculatus]
MCILSCYFQRLVQFNDCKGIMPAKIGDPVSASLRQSLSASENSGDLDKRLVLSSSQVLNISVEYEETESYNASVLDNLKHKYVRIDTDKPIVNGGVPTQRSIENQANREMRPEPDSVLPTPKVILFPAERVQIGWRGNFPVGAGMINVGNTCYLNSTLQALFHIPALVNWLQSDSDHLNKCFVANGSMQGECINCAMSKTLKASQNKSGNVIKPYLIYNKLKMICKHMVHGQQEDAHEFMRYLIESMEETYLVRFKGEKLDNYSKETTPLNQIFGGYMRTEVNCLQCRGVSTTFQHFQDLLLDIRRASTLDDALASYFQRERLDGDDAYRCERCHKKVSATKKFSIEKPPFVLCIQLKRFSMVGGKINKHVSFTQRLDMTRFLCPQSAYRGSQPLTYRLVSMVTHMGTSVHCGHYTAIAQTSTGHFYQFDDSAVRPISLNAALETNAYIIIYELERIDARQTQNHSSSSKPATVTSGTSTPILACNGQKSNNNSGTFNCPLLPSNHKPGPSIIPSPPNMKINSGANTVTSKISPGIIPAVHKPSVGCHLPPAKERYEPYHNGNHKSPKCGEESDEYEWVEKTRETINVNRSNGQINGWGHSSRSEVSCYLMKQSHQGYGPSVSSWNGGRSHIDREVENDRHDERKRSHSKYDEELDMGRVKKIKHNNEFTNNQPKCNYFDEFQKRLIEVLLLPKMLASSSKANPSCSGSCVTNRVKNLEISNFMLTFLYHILNIKGIVSPSLFSILKC